MKRPLLLFTLFLLSYTQASPQCGVGASFVGSTSLVSGSGNGTLVSPYTVGSVVRVTITVAGAYLQLGSNWWHGVQVNLGSNFTFANPISFARSGFPGINGRWRWSYGFSGGNGPGTAGPGIYYDSDNDGDPSNNYGVNTLLLAGTFRFNVVVTGSNTTTAGITANIMSDGYSGAWASGSCDADALGSAVMSVLGNIVLPVNMLSIQARKTAAETITLNWETATEQNVSHFEIEYSTDGRSWSVIGTKAARGNSNVIQSYSFLHEQVRGENNFYRIRTVDRDGRSSYSRVVTVKQEFTLRYSFDQVYPNPVREGKISIGLLAPESGEGKLAVYNATGLLVYSSGAEFMRGMNTLSLPVTDFVPGIYLIRFTTGATSLTTRFVKE